jgi:hypothetical protein
MPTPLQDPGSGYLSRAPERDSGASDTSSDTTTAQRGRNFRGDSKSAHREVQWAGSVCVRETSIRSPRGPGRSAKANDAEAHCARGLTGGDGDQCGSAVPRPGRASVAGLVFGLPSQSQHNRSLRGLTGFGRWCSSGGQAARRGGARPADGVAASMKTLVVN